MSWRERLFWVVTGALWGVLLWHFPAIIRGVDLFRAGG